MENNKNSFIPETNAEAYTTYRVQLFRMVPENAKLICQNRFTGKIVVKESGFHLILPWYRSKLVNITKTNIDYPKEKYLTKDGIVVEVDPALTVRIVDPVKFEFRNTNPLQELGVLTKDVIRIFIASKDSNDLIGRNYNIDEKDPTHLFEDFENRTGLHISHLFFKNVELPKDIVEANERVKAAGLRKKEADKNAEIVKVEADAKAYSDQTILSAKIAALLKNRSLTQEQKIEILKLIALPENANVVAGLASNNGMVNDSTLSSVALFSSLLDRLNTHQKEDTSLATETVPEEVSRPKVKKLVPDKNNEITCPNCGAKLPYGVSRCSNCLTDLI